MLNLFRMPYVRRLGAENERLRAQIGEAKTVPARMLALVASKNKEINALKDEIRELKRERDRDGRFTHEAP